MQGFKTIKSSLKILLKISFFTLIVSFLFSSCAVPNRQVFKERGDDGYFGFFAPNGSYLSNPQSNGARIYILRPNIFLDNTVSYTVNLEYNAKLNHEGQVQSERYEDSLGYLVPGTVFYMDILPNTPIALSADTKVKTYTYFTPKAARVYCLEADIARDAFARRASVELISYETCNSIVGSLQDNLQNSRQYQKQWREQYLGRYGSHVLDGKVFWLSYMMDSDDLQKSAANVNAATSPYAPPNISTPYGESTAPANTPQVIFIY